MEIPAGTLCGKGGELVNMNPASPSRRGELRGIAGLMIACLACLGLVACGGNGNHAQPGLQIQWDKTTVVTNTTPTL
jgi:hypothetical protein